MELGWGEEGCLWLEQRGGGEGQLPQGFASEGRPLPLFESGSEPRSKRPGFIATGLAADLEGTRAEAGSQRRRNAGRSDVRNVDSSRPLPTCFQLLPPCPWKGQARLRGWRGGGGENGQVLNVL